MLLFCWGFVLGFFWGGGFCGGFFGGWVVLVCVCVCVCVFNLFVFFIEKNKVRNKQDLKSTLFNETRQYNIHIFDKTIFLK